MSYFRADKPSARMEIRFTSITEQLMNALQWPLVASVVYFCGWIRTLMPVLRAACSNTLLTDHEASSASYCCFGRVGVSSRREGFRHVEARHAYSVVSHPVVDVEAIR